MKRNFAAVATIIAFSLFLFGCQRAAAPQTAEAPTPAASPSPQVAEVAPTPELEPAMLPGPNAVPKDTRIVVNIPAFRMDVFSNGALVKSYRIGIGYPQFPLPTGLRKADSIIFNPTWTPPDSPWVSSMNVTPGERIAAGSKLNPLGPIKIPIGMPSLIHGGKPLSKIGTFASHGCVGLTNEQVRDFTQTLVEASNTDLTAQTMAEYLNKRTRTRLVKLNSLVPVELRYETIVVEGGVLHIYRDVYDRNTNTEENLRTVLAANGGSYDNLTSEEKGRVLDALDAMSRRRPKKKSAAKADNEAARNSAPAINDANDRKAEALRLKQLRNQKEIVIEINALNGKGYPAPMNLDTGVRTDATAVAATRLATNKR